MYWCCYRSSADWLRDSLRNHRIVFNKTNLKEKKCIINNTTLKFHVPIQIFIIFKVKTVQIICVLNTISHRSLRQLPNILMSLVDSVKFPPFLILWCFESLCLLLFSGSWMLGAMFCLNARKKCFGNHCCPCHSVSLTCSSGWKTWNFSHCYCIFLISFSRWTWTRPYIQCPVTTYVHNFHHSRNWSLALANIPKWRPYIQCPVTTYVQNFHHSRNWSLALATIPK